MKHKTLLLSVCLALAATAAAHATGEGSRLTLALTGDIMMGTDYPSPQLPPQEGRQLFVEAAPVLTRATVAAGNLEGVMADGGTSTKKLSRSSYAFRTPSAFAPRLSEAGFDFVSLANNHAFDFGADGAASTRRLLQAEGIAFAGLKDSPNAAVIERDGVKIGFCAFGHNAYTWRHQDLETARQAITRLVNECDIVVVSFHGGAEGRNHSRLPYGKETFYGEDRGSLRDFAHFCIDAGADVVFGHGPHVPRAIELYKEHLVAYSLGNFCTPYGISLTGVSGLAPLLELQVTPDGRFLQGCIHSFIQRRGHGPSVDPDHRAAREIKRLTALDMPLTPLVIADDGLISRK